MYHLFDYFAHRVTPENANSCGLYNLKIIFCQQKGYLSLVIYFTFWSAIAVSVLDPGRLAGNLGVS